MGKAGGLFVNLGINTTQFTKGIRGAKKELTGFQKVGAKLKSVFSPANLGFTALVGGAALVGIAIGNAVRTFKDFEKANSDLKAVLGGTDREMKALSDQAKALGVYNNNERGYLDDKLAILNKINDQSLLDLQTAFDGETLDENAINRLAYRTDLTDEQKKA